MIEYSRDRIHILHLDLSRFVVLIVTLALLRKVGSVTHACHRRFALFIRCLMVQVSLVSANVVVGEVSLNLRKCIVNGVVVAATIHRHVVGVLRRGLIYLLKLCSRSATAATTANNLPKDFASGRLSQPLVGRVDIKVLLNESLQLSNLALLLMPVDFILNTLMLLPSIQSHELVLKQLVLEV